ncbi:MAG TPA: hypothetical protein VFE87_02160 [Candidatus Paceibacterota bacterium]|nr:hypothetical protein [Candidatus Paceibacterota bacterium]
MRTPGTAIGIPEDSIVNRIIPKYKYVKETSQSRSRDKEKKIN